MVTQVSDTGHRSGEGGAPAVSVVVPCHNLGLYLDEAIESVLAQSYQDFEIVIVNDGSTDPYTSELLTNYQRPRTRVVTTSNQGLARARNVAISMATGRYVCALDADDVLAPTYLEKAVRILDDTPGVSFVSCWLETFGDESWTWKQERCDLPILLAECTVCTAALVRRSALVAVGCYDERMPRPGYEDWDLWISLVEQGFQGVILQEVLFYYRRRAGSMSSICCTGEAHVELMRYLVEKHRSSYERHLNDVLRRKDHDTAELLRTNRELEHHIDTWLVPEINRRREELERLRRKLERAQADRRARDEHAGMAARIDELSAALAATSHEVIALRASMSWKLTTPLRAMYDLIRRGPS